MVHIIWKLTDDGLEYHFIYCGYLHSLWSSLEKINKRIIKDFKLESAIFKGLSMLKSHLVKKEMMEKHSVN